MQNNIKNIIKYLNIHKKILFLLFSFLMSFEYLILGPFSYVRSGDNLDSLVPRFTLFWKELFNNGIQYWSPYFTGGIDNLSNGVNYLSLDTILFSLFPGWIAIGIILTSGFYLGGYFTYRICRHILKLNNISSIFAGIIYTFSLSLIDMLPHILGLAILPVAIYYLEKLFIKSQQRRLGKYLLAMLLGIIVSLFSSLILILPFTLFAITIWFFIIRKKFNWSFIFILLIFFIFSILSKIQEAWALLINLNESQRGGIDYFNASIKTSIFELKKTLILNWFPLLIFIPGSLLLKIKDKKYIRIKIITLIILITTPFYKQLSTNFGEFFSLLSDYDFSRFNLLLPLFLSICVAFILHNIPSFITLQNEKSKKKYSLQIAIVYLLLFILIFFNILPLKIKHSKTWLRAGSYIAKTHSPDIEKTIEKSNQDSPFRTAVVSRDNSLIPTISNFYKIESIDGHANITTNHNISNFKLLSKNESVKSSLYFVPDKSNHTITSFEQNPEKFINTNLLSLSNVKYILSTMPINLSGLDLLHSPSINQIYNYKKMTPGQKISYWLDENFNGKKLLIYENKNFFPRFFLTKKIKEFPGNESLLNGLKNANLKDLREQAFVESSDIQNIDISTLKGDQGNIKIKQYTPDKIQLEVYSNGPSIMIITNNYSPFWKAYVNNEEQNIIRVYNAYMGLYLTEENSNILLEYNPPYQLKKIFQSK